MPYRAPCSVEPVTDSKGRKHYQYYSIVQVKVQLAEQRKTAKKKSSKTRPLELYEASSQETTPSPDVRRRRKRDWGGSHRDSRPANWPRGSRVSEENEDAEQSEESTEY